MTPDQFARVAAMVDAAVTARRKLWAIVCRRERRGTSPFLDLDASEVEEWAGQEGSGLAGEVRKCGGRVPVQFLETHASLRPFLAEFYAGVGQGLTGSQVRADAASLVWRNIKAHHPVAAERGVFHVFRGICEALERRCAAAASSTNDGPTAFEPDTRRRDRLPLDCSSPALQGELRRELAALLQEKIAMESDSSVDRIAADYLDLFFDVGFSLEDLNMGGVTAGTGIRPEWLDAHFLLSRLYGTRTGIPGFDVLFEGGINLAERIANPFSPARTILIRGPFNAGKSILGLCLAAEIARKGGLSTVVSLEGSSDVLKAYLSSFNLADTIQREVRLQHDDGLELVAYRMGGGELRLLSYPKSGFDLDELLKHISQHVAQEDAHDQQAERENRPRLLGPRLLIIDPVNSVLDFPSSQPEIRRKVMESVEEVRKHVGNVVLVAESPEAAPVQRKATQTWTDVLPYVADVVIDLSNERHHEYDQRYIQVCKSRFQRERRGRHPIAIIPGRGLVIAPSSVALRSEFNRPRWASEEKPPIRFGLEAVDRLIPLGALLHADAIVLRGPQRSFKTLLGLHFVAAHAGSSPERVLEARALILADRNDLRLHPYVDACSTLPRDLEEQVTFLPLEQGYVQPGRVLRSVQQCFEDARARGCVYDRVLIPHVGRWDLNCPFVRDDPGFAGALLDLLKLEKASTVFLCSEKHSEEASNFQRTVLDRAEALLDFQHLEFGGAQRVLMRCVRTRAVPLSQDWHEITLQGGNLQIDPSLLRVHEHGRGTPPEAVPVKITLNLFQVGPVQKKYHAGIKARLQSVLTTGVVVKRIDRAVLHEASRLGLLSVGSDLQLVQIDEFQLPALKQAAHGRSLLQPYSIEAAEQWKGDAGLMQAITRAEGLPGRPHDAVVALPYYRNIAFLAISRKHPEIVKAASSWKSLADLAKRWPKRAGKPFFNFAKKPEDYNCVFLEIAFSLAPKEFLGAEVRDGRAREELMGWLRGPKFREALEIFHPLCADAHHRKQDKSWDQGPPPLSGAVTRLWFTALRFWLDDRAPEDKTENNLTAKERAEIEIVPLPGNVALSGDWYLGVWAHSAVPEIGMRIMESLTSPDAQLERLALGIGLPTESHLLVNNNEQLFPGCVIGRNPDVGALVSNARCRSHFFNYNLIQPVLSQHLTSFLSQPMDRGLVERTRTALVKDVSAVIRADREGIEHR